MKVTETFLKNLERECPICSGNMGRILHSFNFELPKDCPLPDCYDLVECKYCGFVFADTRATQQEYDKFYKEQSKYENPIVSSEGNTSSWDKERFEGVAEYLEQALSKDSTILDIGCANGGLLLALRRAGFTRLAGLDPSRQCVQNVRTAGIEAEQGGLFTNKDLSPDSQRVDGILLSHVLEHVRDLSAALASVCTQLTSEGLVYVEVPDASRYAMYYKVSYYYFDSEHINHFDPVSLKNLFRTAGFTPYDIRQHDIPSSVTGRYPVISALFQKVSELSCRKLEMASDAVNSIKKYLEHSAQDRVFNVINMLADEQSDVIVWGAGQYAFRLLSSTRLKECNIIAFIDKDSGKHGATLCSVPITSSERLQGFKGAIVICSALHANDILSEIRMMGLHNKVIILGGEEAT